MSTTKIRQIGNSDGLTFRAEQLREAGFARGDEVLVEVREGRITLVWPDSDYVRAMEALDFCVRRYDATRRKHPRAADAAPRKEPIFLIGPAACGLAITVAVGGLMRALGTPQSAAGST